MSGVKNFFHQPNQIVKTIGEVEKLTSGEIKIHLESRCKGALEERAGYVFRNLKMNKLPQRNGVLIYLAIQDKKVCILGDENIHKRVGDGFWQETISKLIADFKAQKFDEGIIHAIKDVGDKLKSFFPYNSENASNDLSDDISYGE